jgi:hypothetical protein
VIEVAFEDDEVGLGEVKEEIGSFGVKFPESVSCAPERMLFVDPYSVFFVFLKDVLDDILMTRERQTFHLAPSLLSDSSSFSETFGNS